MAVYLVSHEREHEQETSGGCRHKGDVGRSEEMEAGGQEGSKERVGLAPRYRQRGRGMTTPTWDTPPGDGPERDPPGGCEHEAEILHGVAFCRLCRKTLSGNRVKRLTQLERATLLGHEYGVRTQLVLGLLEWCESARVPGDFLCAVLSNDLKDAVVRADYDSIRAIKGIVVLLLNKFPTPCWGSPDALATWKGGYTTGPHGIEPLPAMRLAGPIDDTQPNDDARERKES